MSFAAGYDPTPLVPRITILDAGGIRDAARDFAMDAANGTPNGMAYGFGRHWIIDGSDLKVYAHGLDGARDTASDWDLDAANARPRGITAGASHFWVVDLDDRKVYAYDSDGTRDSALDFALYSGNQKPRGITFWNSRLWVVDTNGRVYCYGTDGTHEQTSDWSLDPKNGSPRGIAFGDGRFWVADNADGKVFSYNSDGTRTPASDFKTDWKNRKPYGISYGGSRLWMPQSSVPVERGNKVFCYEPGRDVRFVYESGGITGGTPRQDFELTGWQIQSGINTNHGIGMIRIRDDKNSMFASNRIRIGNGWTLLVELGKSPSGLELWFAGVIRQPEIVRPSAGKQDIVVTAIGWGSITARRIANINKFQRRLDNGISLDATDGSTSISELFKTLLRNYWHMSLPGIGPPEGITMHDVRDIDIQLPDFQRRHQTVAVMLNELAEIAGAYWGIGPDRDAYLHLRGQEDSGFLITSDLTALLTRGWNQRKIMYIANRHFGFQDSTLDSGYTIAHGLGAQYAQVDYEQTAADAQLDLSTHHHAFPFEPRHDNVSRITMFLSKSSGDLLSPLHVSIIGAADDGTPNLDDVRQSAEIPAERLNEELVAGRYVEIQFDFIPVTHGEKLFALVEKYDGQGGAVPSIDYQTGGGTYYRSADGSAYSEYTGNPKMRSYASKTVHIVGQNTTLSRFRRTAESVFAMDDFPDEQSALIAFEGILESLGRTRRIYNPVTVSAPDSRPRLGASARLVDVLNGLDATVNLISYTIGTDAEIPEGPLGAYSMVISFEEWF